MAGSYGDWLPCRCHAGWPPPLVDVPSIIRQVRGREGLACVSLLQGTGMVEESRRGNEYCIGHTVCLSISCVCIPYAWGWMSSNSTMVQGSNTNPPRLPGPPPRPLPPLLPRFNLSVPSTFPSLSVSPLFFFFVSHHSEAILDPGPDTNHALNRRTAPPCRAIPPLLLLHSLYSTPYTHPAVPQFNPLLSHRIPSHPSIHPNQPNSSIPSQTRLRNAPSSPPPRLTSPLPLSSLLPHPNSLQAATAIVSSYSSAPQQHQSGGGEGRGREPVSSGRSVSALRQSRISGVAFGGSDV